MTNKRKCATCGANMVEYKHGMSRGLAKVLARISIDLKGVPGPIEFADVRLAHSPKSNLHKLHYWGLLAKIKTEDAKGGIWMFTELGRSFIAGECTIKKNVWTYRGEVVREDGPDISIGDVSGGWKYRPDYAAEAVVHQ